jgi:hypothetical protein
MPKPTMPPPITNPSYILSSMYSEVVVLAGTGGAGSGIGDGSGTGMVPLLVSLQGIVSLLQGIVSFPGMIGTTWESYLLPR